jgi:hypothetical protein
MWQPCLGKCETVHPPFQHESLPSELSISNAEYLAERGTTVNMKPSSSPYYSLFRIWLLS